MSYQIGYGERPIVLADNRQVGEGRARMEQVWDLRIRGGCHTLTLANTDWPTCHLQRNGDGIWEGRWLEHERMSIEFIPLEG